MELVENLKKLPKEIFIKIWSYTYSIQPANLLEDIRDYPISLEYILYYYEDWFYEMYEYKYWIIHDIFGYIAGYIAGNITGYIAGNIASFSNDSVDNLYTSFWKRAIQCSNMDIDTLSKYIYRLEHNKIDTQVRLLWGMMYPSERISFIDSIDTFIEEDEEYEEDYDF